MAWRIVKQPNGLYARYSEVVDDFTHTDMSRDEAMEVCREHMGRDDAEAKLQRADDEPLRWQEAIDSMRALREGHLEHFYVSREPETPSRHQPRSDPSQTPPASPI